jgi:hypothetical protein
MNQAFDTSYEEDEGEEDEGEEVGEEETDGGSPGWGFVGRGSAAQLQVLVFS